MGGCYNYSCTAAKTHVDPILSFIQLLSCLACTNFSKNTAYGNFFPCIEYVSTILLYTIGQRWTEAEMKLFHWAFSTIQLKILNISGDGSLFSLNIKLHGMPILNFFELCVKHICIPTSLKYRVFLLPEW